MVHIYIICTTAAFFHSVYYSITYFCNNPQLLHCIGWFPSSAFGRTDGRTALMPLARATEYCCSSLSLSLRCCCRSSRPVLYRCCILSVRGCWIHQPVGRWTGCPTPAVESTRSSNPNCLLCAYVSRSLCVDGFGIWRVPL